MSGRKKISYTAAESEACSKRLGEYKANKDKDFRRTLIDTLISELSGPRFPQNKGLTKDQFREVNILVTYTLGNLFTVTAIENQNLL
jgi:hypothetical protein